MQRSTVGRQLLLVESKANQASQKLGEWERLSLAEAKPRAAMVNTIPGVRELLSCHASMGGEAG